MCVLAPGWSAGLLVSCAARINRLLRVRRTYSELVAVGSSALLFVLGTFALPFDPVISPAAFGRPSLAMTGFQSVSAHAIRRLYVSMRAFVFVIIGVSRRVWE